MVIGIGIDPRIIKTALNKNKTKQIKHKEEAAQASPMKRNRRLSPEEKKKARNEKDKRTQANQIKHKEEMAQAQKRKDEKIASHIVECVKKAQLQKEKEKDEKIAKMNKKTQEDLTEIKVKLDNMPQPNAQEFVQQFRQQEIREQQERETEEINYREAVITYLRDVQLIVVLGQWQAECARGDMAEKTTQNSGEFSVESNLVEFFKNSSSYPLKGILPAKERDKKIKALVKAIALVGVVATDSTDDALTHYVNYYVKEFITLLTEKTFNWRNFSTEELKKKYEATREIKAVAYTARFVGDTTSETKDK